MATPVHIFKTARRQLRKIRHRGAKTDTEKRLLASADQQRQEGLGWRYDGFKAFTDAQLFEALARHGIAHDAESFRRDARQAGSPTSLYAAWEKQCSAEGKWKDLPLLAVRELWRRLLPELRSAEVVSDQLDELLEEAEVAAERTALWLQAARIVVACCLPGGAADKAFFEAVTKESGSDLAGWLVEMPASLLGTPEAAEAPALCEAFAQLVDSTSMLAERAELLAQLGRGEEAKAQIEALLGQSPEEPVVLLKAGAVFELLGDQSRAQHYLKLYTELMKDPASAEARARAARNKIDLPHPKLVSAKSELPRASDGPGPNDRCPCGSGKKYKRCHGMAS